MSLILISDSRSFYQALCRASRMQIILPNEEIIIIVGEKYMVNLWPKSSQGALRAHTHTHKDKNQSVPDIGKKKKLIVPKRVGWGGNWKTETDIDILLYILYRVVTHGSESWTIKKAECQIIDAFEFWCWRRL